MERNLFCGLLGRMEAVDGVSLIKPVSHNDYSGGRNPGSSFLYKEGLGRLRTHKTIKTSQAVPDFSPISLTKT